MRTLQQQHDEATAKTRNARSRLAIARTPRVRREAGDDLEFWSSKAANLAALIAPQTREVA